MYTTEMIDRVISGKVFSKILFFLIFILILYSSISDGIYVNGSVGLIFISDPSILLRLNYVIFDNIKILICLALLGIYAWGYTGLNRGWVDFKKLYHSLINRFTKQLDNGGGVKGGGFELEPMNAMNITKEGE